MLNTACVTSFNPHNNSDRDPSSPISWVDLLSTERGRNWPRVTQLGSRRARTQPEPVWLRASASSPPHASLLLPSNGARDWHGISVGLQAAEPALTSPSGDCSVTLLHSHASLVGWVRLIGMSMHSPGSYHLSFTLKFFLLFLVCKIFHHLLCRGRMFAENISLPL